MPNPSDYDDIFGPGNYPSNGPLDFDKECACDCSLSSRTGEGLVGPITSSGWCFPTQNIFTNVPVISPQPGDIADVSVTRTSGTNGICDTLFGNFGVPAYYCIQGRVVRSGYPEEDRTADAFIVLPDNNCEVYGNSGSLPTDADGLPYYHITGIPMTYYPENQKYRSKFSMSICNIELSGCCDENLRGRSYPSCYTIYYRINSEDDCENQLFQALDAGLGARYIKVTTCERHLSRRKRRWCLRFSSRSEQIALTF
jgi:hypothetical protein